MDPIPPTTFSPQPPTTPPPPPAPPVPPPPPPTTLPPLPVPPVMPPPPPPPPPPPKKKSFTWLLILVFLLLLASTGVLAYQYYQLKTQTVNSAPSSSLTPTPLVSPQPSAETETANWKTYTNTQFQFAFRYPDETNGLYGFFCDDLEMFALDETPKIGSQCGPRGSYYTIEIKAVKGEPIKEDELSSFEGAQSIKETITIDEITGIKATFTQVKPAPIPEKWIEILMYKNGIRYHFILSDMAFENIFNQILSTFRFIDPPEAPGEGG